MLAQLSRNCVPIEGPAKKTFVESTFPEDYDPNILTISANVTESIPIPSTTALRTLSNLVTAQAQGSLKGILNTAAKGLATSTSFCQCTETKREPGTAMPNMKRVMLDQGVLDLRACADYDAIVQQIKCIGCHPRSLAEGVAETLPYGCPYKQRRSEPPRRKFAVAKDRSEPGAIDFRRPLPNTSSSNATYFHRFISGDGTRSYFQAKRPIVINMFAQWELGPALKYNRIPCPAKYGPDSC